MRANRGEYIAAGAPISRDLSNGKNAHRPRESGPIMKTNDCAAGGVVYAPRHEKRTLDLLSLFPLEVRDDVYATWYRSAVAWLICFHFFFSLVVAD